MKGQVVQVRRLGGQESTLPQRPESATRIENWTVAADGEALSSRVGYEKYRAAATTQFAPFTALGRIDSLFILNQAPGGARQSILFESGGGLYLYVETGIEHQLVLLATRTIPAGTEASSVYAQLGDRVVVTNGYEPPLLIRPWPLGRHSTISAQVVSQICRPLGFQSIPAAPQALDVTTISAATGGTSASSSAYSGNSTCNWYPAEGLAISFPGAFGLGLPNATDAALTNSYRFRVAYISDTGSISPMSGDVELEWDLEKGQRGYRYCPTLRIPLGPAGTVGRRIYGTTEGGRDFYFVADVRNNEEQTFHVTRRSSSFSVPAPGDTDSVVFPARYARVCAVFKGCVFVDGGRDEAWRLFFSNPGLADQWGAANYITLSSSGGGITCLYSYYNNLVVFRENSVDVLTGDYPNFNVQVVTDQVSCRSAHSIESIPGLGVVFLADDGIYALTGGLDGGSVFSVVELGRPIRRELARLTQSCAARAVGRYSPRERAYHLYLPVDGDDRPGLGVVYHLEKQGWSIRTGFPVGCLDRNFQSELVFGHHTGVEAGADSPAGLFVLSGAPSMGGTIVGDNYVLGAPPTSIYESCWHDFGDPQVKKQVQYVTLWIQTTGSVLINLSHYKDFERTAVSSNSRYEAQPADRPELAVYDTALVGAEWEERQLTPIRIPVAQQSCSWFKFRLETTDDILLVGYDLEYVSRGTTVVAGRRR